MGRKDIGLRAALCHRYGKCRMKHGIQCPVLGCEFLEFFEMLARVAVHLGCLLVLETRFSLEKGFDERRQTVGHRMFFDSCGGPCNIAKHCSLSGAAGMSAIPVLVEDEFIRRFFCQCDFRPHAAFIVDDISAFIKNAGQLDAVSLQVFCRQNGSLLVRCALHFLIVAKGQVNIKGRLEMFFQKFLDGIHFGREERLAVLRSSSPEETIFHLACKGRMAPLFFASCRHDVLMRHQKDRLPVRIFRRPAEKEACLSDHRQFQFLIDHRICRLKVLMQLIKPAPVRMLIIHA